MERQRGGDGGAQVVLAHGVAETQHPFVLGPAPLLSLRVPSCHHPQLPSIREDPSTGCLWSWLGLHKEAAGCVLRGNGVPRTQGPGGKEQTVIRTYSSPSVSAPTSRFPCSPVPGGSLSLATLVDNPHSLPQHSISGVSHCSQGTMDIHGRPGASLACGSAAASSPRSPLHVWS